MRDESADGSMAALIEVDASTQPNTTASHRHAMPLIHPNAQ